MGGLFTIASTCLLWSLVSSDCSIVDLSRWDLDVDFRLAKRAGLIAAVHKANENFYYKDSSYDNRSAQAYAAGILWGAYYVGKGGKASGAMQAQHFLSIVGNQTDILLALQIAPDLQASITVKEAEDFVTAIRSSTGRLPFIFGFSDVLSSYTSKSVLLTSCPVWVADWTNSAQPKLPPGTTDWRLWEYTDGISGGIPNYLSGIGICSCDRYNGSLEELVKKWPTL